MPEQNCNNLLSIPKPIFNPLRELRKMISYRTSRKRNHFRGVTMQFGVPPLFRVAPSWDFPIGFTADTEIQLCRKGYKAPGTPQVKSVRDLEGRLPRGTRALQNNARLRACKILSSRET